MFPATGIIKTPHLPGAPVITRLNALGAFGFHHATFGHPPAICSSAATGITPSTIEGRCSHPYGSIVPTGKPPAGITDPLTRSSWEPRLDSLFWRSGGHHYYFGNYYGSAYAGLGYRPWFAHRYDGLYNYHRWSQRGNGNWAADQQRLFHDRHIGRVDGPPRTLAQQHAGNRMVVPLHEARDRNVGISRSSLASGNQRGPTLAHVQTAHMPRVVNNTPTTAHTFASRSTPHVVHSSPATAHAHATSQVHHVAHAAPQHHATAHASHGGGHSSHGGGHSGGGGHHGHH